MKNLLERGHNCLLFGLNSVDALRWRTQIEEVELKAGTVLCMADSQLTHVFFPIDSRVSLVHEMNDGNRTEIATVGSEGCVGLAAIMSGLTRATAIVTTPGKAWRVRSRFVKIELHNSEDVLDLFLRFTQGLMAEMAQVAACNRFHTLEQQLCRWLLAFDQNGKEMLVTHQLIADRLGVRRATITEAAKKLFDKGHITTGRGRITIVNRPAIMQCACECYPLIQDTYTRIYDQEWDSKAPSGCR